MNRTLTIGSTGPDVGELQMLLNRKPPTRFPLLRIDNIFGPKVLARVKEFQSANGLVVDGIAGPKTFAKLQQTPGEAPARRSGTLCGNSDLVNHSGSPFTSEAFVSSFAAQGGLLQHVGFGGSPTVLAFAGVPTLRRLTTAQINTATNVFGASLDFSTIFISDKAGAGGLPFTVGVPKTPFSGPIQIMNCGTFSPPDSTLIHELTHVWQSQHHPNVTEFMTNSVGGQGAALLRNKAEAQRDPSVKSGDQFPLHFPFSTYAFVPGKPFGDYAAEQIANAVEHNVTAIVSHVRSVAPGAMDADNKTSLATVRIGDRRISGTIF